MYHFFHRVFKPAFGPETKLLFSDTDSFLFKIRSKLSLDDELLKVKQWLDFSGYDKSHPLFSMDNSFRPGYFKNELLGKAKIDKFVGLCAKSYSLLTSNPNDNTTAAIIKAKGVVRSFARKHLTFADYEHVLKEAELQKAKFWTIRHRNYGVQTVQTTKVSLSPLCLKRQVFTLYNEISSINCKLLRFWFCYRHSTGFGSCLIPPFLQSGTCPFCQQEEEAEQAKRLRKMRQQQSGPVWAKREHSCLPAEEEEEEERETPPAKVKCRDGEK